MEADPRASPVGLCKKLEFYASSVFFAMKLSSKLALTCSSVVHFELRLLAVGLRTLKSCLRFEAWVPLVPLGAAALRRPVARCWYSRGAALLGSAVPPDAAEIC